MNSNDNTFFNVTNRMIYDKQLEQDKRLESIEKHVVKTNGQVKLAKWIATTALSLAVLALGWVFIIAKYIPK